MQPKPEQGQVQPGAPLLDAKPEQEEQVLDSALELQAVATRQAERASVVVDASQRERPACGCAHFELCASWFQDEALAQWRSAVDQTPSWAENLLTVCLERLPH